ncbi:hypothetical protein RhiirC2_782661 [Rhizophagus irregularis]|uniref:Uncharacterized protein n=1 Tax=Rhizophagus irregularis TaxID=588596 RepID=A0A2N1N2N8_9GLOM|nr:hypothetical protein RhiirC2_782661 [Rhizophagus irregularis]
METSEFWPGTWNLRPVNSGLELGNGDRFRPGTWNLRPILAWNLEIETERLLIETDSGLELGNRDW